MAVHAGQTTFELYLKYKNFFNPNNKRWEETDLSEEFRLSEEAYLRILKSHRDRAALIAKAFRNKQHAELAISRIMATDHGTWIGGILDGDNEKLINQRIKFSNNPIGMFRTELSNLFDHCTEKAELETLLGSVGMPTGEAWKIHLQHGQSISYDTMSIICTYLPVLRCDSVSNWMNSVNQTLIEQCNKNVKVVNNSVPAAALLLKREVISALWAEAYVTRLDTLCERESESSYYQSIESKENQNGINHGSTQEGLSPGTSSREGEGEPSWW